MLRSGLLLRRTAFEECEAADVETPRAPILRIVPDEVPEVSSDLARPADADGRSRPHTRTVGVGASDRTVPVWPRGHFARSAGPPLPTPVRDVGRGRCRTVPG